MNDHLRQSSLGNHYPQLVHPQCCKGSTPVAPWKTDIKLKPVEVTPDNLGNNKGQEDNEFRVGKCV